MTKPVLYITDDVLVTARKIFPQARHYKIVGRSYAEGLFKSGDAFLIVRGDDLDKLRQQISGTEFSRFETDGQVSPEAIDMAKSRVRP